MCIMYNEHVAESLIPIWRPVTCCQAMRSSENNSRGYLQSAEPWSIVRFGIDWYDSFISETSPWRVEWQVGLPLLYLCTHSLASSSSSAARLTRNVSWFNHPTRSKWIWARQVLGRDSAWVPVWAQRQAQHLLQAAHRRHRRWRHVFKQHDTTTLNQIKETRWLQSPPSQRHHHADHFIIWRSVLFVSINRSCWCLFL